MKKIIFLLGLIAFTLTLAGCKTQQDPAKQAEKEAMKQMKEAEHNYGSTKLSKR